MGIFDILNERNKKDNQSTTNVSSVLEQAKEETSSLEKMQDDLHSGINSMFNSEEYGNRVASNISEFEKLKQKRKATNIDVRGFVKETAKNEDVAFSLKAEKKEVVVEEGLDEWAAKIMQQMELDADRMGIKK